MKLRNPTAPTNQKVQTVKYSWLTCQKFNLNSNYFASFVYLTVLEPWRKTAKNLKERSLVPSRYDSLTFIKFKMKRFELNSNYPHYSSVFIYTRGRQTPCHENSVTLANLTHILSWKKKRTTKTTHLISTGLVLVLILRLSLLLSTHRAHGSICGKLDCYFEHDKAGVGKLNNDTVYFERINIFWRFWTEAIWTNWRECCVSFQFHSESAQMLRASSFENVSTKLLNKPFNKNLSLLMKTQRALLLQAP